jgi:hypothetical protein
MSSTWYMIKAKDRKTGRLILRWPFRAASLRKAFKAAHYFLIDRGCPDFPVISGKPVEKKEFAR